MTLRCGRDKEATTCVSRLNFFEIQIRCLLMFVFVFNFAFVFS
jgi:hypothetical protein